MKICAKCKEGKDETCFSPSEFKRKRSRCKVCLQEYKKEYNSKPENKEKIINGQKRWVQENKERTLERQSRWYYENKIRLTIKNQQYYQENKEEILKNSKQYCEEHKEEMSNYQKVYRKENKEEINKYHKVYRKTRKKIDPLFKLRTYVSGSIHSVLRGKNGSILKYLPYTIEELKNHIESQFEDWMSWNNWGKYNAKTWNDNDKSTWTWNLDHIKPHSHFYYETMDCQEFRDCWALENLRPYSAKQNILDGNRR